MENEDGSVKSSCRCAVGSFSLHSLPINNKATKAKKGGVSETMKTGKATKKMESELMEVLGLSTKKEFQLMRRKLNWNNQPSSTKKIT